MTESEQKPWISTYPEGIRWDADIQARPVFDMLDVTAAQHGDRPAFNFLGFQHTWAEINDLSIKLAAGLQQLGAEKGKKIGIFLPNSPYFVIAYYAIMRTGATAVNYNPLYAESELANQIEDSETDIIITADLKVLYDKIHKMLHDTRLNHLVMCKFTDILKPPKNILFELFKGKELAQIEHPKRVTWFHDIVEADHAFTPAVIDPVNDIALLQYTGGTTGIPKGAMLTHQNIVANTEQSAMWLGGDMPAGQGRMLGVLPFFHVFAMTAVMNFSVRLGFEIVALPRFELDQTLKLIHKTKPHYFPAVPAIYNGINNHKKVHKYDLTSLRYCISGGAALPVEVKKSFEDKTGCVVVEGYGLTESSPVVCCNPAVGENKPGSIGLPLPQTEVYIAHEVYDDKDLTGDERGELCVRGPQVMKGYWNRADATAETIRDGWLHTGDVAVMDEDGYVYIVDRIKDMIITNGYNVYPRNIEEAIYLHPSVEECIVAGLPDTQRGEIVKAWIKIKDDRTLTIEDLKEFLKDKLSPMEMPKRIEFRDQPLPKTMIGKLSRKDIVAEELEGKS